MTKHNVPTEAFAKSHGALEVDHGTVFNVVQVGALVGFFTHIGFPPGSASSGV
jgi:hypothetical protein